MMTRAFHTGSGEDVVLRIFALREEHGDWFTRWTITGLTSGDVDMISGGVDAVQSVVFALAAAGDRLAGEDDSLMFIGGKGPQLPRTDLDAPSGQWVASIAIPTV